MSRLLVCAFIAVFITFGCYPGAAFAEGWLGSGSMDVTVVRSGASVEDDGNVEFESVVSDGSATAVAVEMVRRVSSAASSESDAAPSGVFKPFGPLPITGDEAGLVGFTVAGIVACTAIGFFALAGAARRREGGVA